GRLGTDPDELGAGDPVETQRGRQHQLEHPRQRPAGAHRAALPHNPRQSFDQGLRRLGEVLAMSRHIRQAAAALALLAVAGCSGGSGGTPADSDGPSMLGVGGAVLHDTVSARKAPAAAATAPDPQAMAAEALAANPGP